MGIDINTLAAAKNYVDETLVGAGAIKGEDGFSPIIAENADNTDEVYKLNITTADKTFTTANLKGDKGADGVDGLSPVISENVNNTEDSYKLDVTDKNGTFTTPNLIGKTGAQGIKGEKGEKGDTGEQGLQGIQGIKGDKGDDGYPFLIYKEYNSLDEFDATHFPEIGLMFMVKTGESFPVYRYTGDADTPYSFVTELATSEGIKGEKGDKGDTGEQGIQGEAGKDGADGTTYTPSIGTVENAEEAFATVEIDEENKQAVFNFGLPKGADGEKAVQFTPVITEDNELAWENDGGLDNPPTVPIQQIFSNAPIGTVISFAGNTAPKGYLACDGQSVAVADYPDLYAVIGNTYGGDAENFNVPNLVDKFIQGSTASGTEKEAGLPNITGELVSLNAGTSNFKDTEFINGAFSATSKWNAVNGSGNMDSYGEVSFDASKSNPIYGNSDTVQPPALTMVYIIKAKYEGVEIEANGITVDSTLSGTSTNPVQNKAIFTALADKANLSDIPTSLPANGGNADTVNSLRDGMPYLDIFSTSLADDHPCWNKKVCVYGQSTDSSASQYIENAPEISGALWYEVETIGNIPSNRAYQLAIGCFGHQEKTIYLRTKHDIVWSEWQNIRDAYTPYVTGTFSGIEEGQQQTVSLSFTPSLVFCWWGTNSPKMCFPTTNGFIVIPDTTGTINYAAFR